MAGRYSRAHSEVWGHFASVHFRMGWEGSAAVIATLALAAALSLSPGVSASGMGPGYSSVSLAAQQQDTKVAGTALVRLTSATKQPSGKWQGELDRGRRNGLVEGSRGAFYRYISPEKRGDKSTLLLAGEAQVISLADDSATVELFLNDASADAPKRGDFVRLALHVPGNTYEGLILDLARFQIRLSNADGSVNFTDLAAALAIHSEGEEKAVLEKIAAEVRALPANPADNAGPTETISRGIYRGKSMPAVLQHCTPVD